MVGKAIAMGINSAINIQITKQIGGGVNGWILTRGMSEWLTYGIPACYCVVLVERLGCLFFDGRHSCARDSFAGHSGLYCGESLVVSNTCFCVRLGQQALNRSVLLLVTAYLS